MKSPIYLASPMKQTKDKNSIASSEEKQSRNKVIYQKLKDAGFDIFLPQDNQAETPQKTLQKELEVIKNCPFMIILLSDTRGVYLEAGYAKALGKKVYAVKVEETRKLSGWTCAWFDYIAENVEELISYLKKELV